MSSYSAVIPLAFLSALALSLVLTPLCERLARRWGVLDLPSSRKVHTQPTPRLGGIAVFLAFAVTALLFLRPVIRDQMTLLLAGAVAFFLIGLVDDLRNAGPWKLAVEGGVVASIVLLGGFRVNLPWPHLGEILAILWIVGVANAMNCIDCTDGVAGGTATIGALALVPIALVAGRLGVAVGAASVAGAALGFLRYNYPPARIFLGDAGSLMVGFLLAALSATLAAPGASLARSVAPVLILGLPVCDFLFVHWKRYQNGVRNPIELLRYTGKDHLPHRLQQAGLSFRQIAWWVYSGAALLGLSAVVLVLWGPLTAAIVAAPLVAAALGGWGAGAASQGRGDYLMAIAGWTPGGSVPSGSSEDAAGVTGP
ncbi:MAG TPA: MraY family glycosyltransferase [bacterium]|nr:MraY family glycosyltransferase [bacterium]